MHETKVADEVWIATALLHREHPDLEDFSVSEIVERAGRENAGRALRPGVRVHATQHCVADRRPNPGRYCMLTATRGSRRRLYRPGDRVHPDRLGAKIAPEREEIPERYRPLLDWYFGEYQKRDVAAAAEEDPLLALRGSGADLWAEEPPDEYVERLRSEWR
jgi:hypothetical protein